MCERVTIGLLLDALVEPGGIPRDPCYRRRAMSMRDIANAPIHAYAVIARVQCFPMAHGFRPGINEEAARMRSAPRKF
jgi:hypothetical protein